MTNAPSKRHSMTPTTVVLSPKSATDDGMTTDGLANLEAISDVISGDKQTDLIDEKRMHILVLIVYFVLQFPILTFGMGSNILNIVVFTLSGQKDSVSIAFTALSISDLGYVVVFMVIRILGLLVIVFQVQSKMNLAWLAYFVSYFGVLFQDVSVVITVFVAIQKCCCVAIPHLFRNVFSTERTVAILVCSSLCMISTYLPILGGMTFVTSVTSPLANETMITIALKPVFYKGAVFWRIFNKIVLPASSQGVTIICLIIMTVRLKKSAKFRSSNATLHDEEDHSSANEGKNSSSKLGYKERRAVTAVALVSAIFVVSTLPAAILSYAKLIAEDFFNSPRNRNLINLIQNSQNIPVHISASVNMFIYLKYNTKYKETFLALFKWKRAAGGHSS